MTVSQQQKIVRGLSFGHHHDKRDEGGRKTEDNYKYAALIHAFHVEAFAEVPEQMPNPIRQMVVDGKKPSGENDQTNNA